MKRNISGIILLVTFVFITGCSSRTAKLPYMDVDKVKLALKRNEFKVLGKGTGTACVSRVWLFSPTPLVLVTWSNDDNGNIEMFRDLLEHAKILAVTNAVNSFKGEADALIMPLYEEDQTSIPPWYWKTCVTVTGKAISLKTDSEMSTQK
ncbi:hypothetical protein KKA14_17805 [bacterium]|nr:hypothetical protein [bacterium]